MQGYVASVLAAGWVTVGLALVSVVVASLIGLCCATLKSAPRHWSSRLVDIYTTLVRGVPDLVLILLVFYSLPALLNMMLAALSVDVYVEFSPFVAGSITLGGIFGAYMTETFHGALREIPRGQLEAAAAYGFSRWQTLRLVTLPQMVRLALPGFTNNWLVLLKATALVSLVGLQDVMFRARGAAESTREPFTFYLLAAGFYLCLTIVSLLVLRWVARRYSLGVKEVSL